jgi:hypothetical protein
MISFEVFAEVDRIPVLRAGGGGGVEVGTVGHVWQSHIQDSCRLTQAKGLARQIYHEPALEVRFVRKAMGTTSFLTVGYVTGRGVQTLVDLPPVHAGWLPLR